MLAAGDRARELRENPAWITGIEHRIETPVLGARDLTTSPSTAASAAAATGGDTGSIDVAELYAPFTHQQLILTEAIGLGGSTKINPSGGALAANPMFSTGLERIGFAARHIFDGSAQRVLAHATSGAALQQNLVAVMEGEVAMAGKLAAVLGTGQTKYVAKRKDVSMNGLVREAIDKALAGLRARRSTTSTPWWSARRPTSSRAS